MQEPIIKGVIERNPGSEKPLRLVFRNGVGVLGSIPVRSRAEAEEIAERLFARLDLSSFEVGTSASVR